MTEYNRRISRHLEIKQYTTSKFVKKSFKGNLKPHKLNKKENKK